MNLKFEIANGEHMPIVRYKGIKLLFDTGASTPVWTRGTEIFKGKFPDAKKMNYKYILSGFGRSELELMDFLKKPSKENSKEFLVDVYSIPEFKLKTEEGCVTWKNLNVAITNREFSGIHLILPFTMFNRMTLSFNQIGAESEIEISSQNDTKYVFTKLSNKFNKELLSYIYAQDSAEKSSAFLNKMDFF